jgi:hypothetical protein
MYLLKDARLEQMNTGMEPAKKPGLDLQIHWIDPLLHKCRKRLCPDILL